jgi:DNA polymerase delta subunit 1
MKRKGDHQEEEKKTPFQKRQKKPSIVRQPPYLGPHPDNQKYVRPPVKCIRDSKQDDLKFQVNCVETYSFEEDPTVGQLARLRLFGTTEDGNSVCAHVTGFLPYLLFPVLDQKVSEKEFQRRLENRLTPIWNDNHSQIVSVEIVQRGTIWHYSPEGSTFPFYKIRLRVPGSVPKCRDALLHMFPQSSFLDAAIAVTTYESNIPFNLRFMIDKNLKGSTWVTLPKATYKFHQRSEPNLANIHERLRKLEPLVSDQKEREKVVLQNIKEEEKMWINRQCVLSHKTCQIDVTVDEKDIISNAEKLEVSPLRVVSFDIECASGEGHFPQPESDPVILIANVLCDYDWKNIPRRRAVVFGLGKYSKNPFESKPEASIESCEMRAFDDEREMLREFARFLKDVDVDMFTGYNINIFDFPYLLKRALALGLSEEFAQLSRLMNYMCQAKEKKTESKQSGARSSMETVIPGRMIVDLYPVMNRDHKLRSYKLNAVAHHFLGMLKEDVHHSNIDKYWRQKENDGRDKLAIYCLRDAVLPLLLLDKLCIIVNTIQLARVQGVPYDWVYGRGAQIKVFSMILRLCLFKNVVIPNFGGGGKKQKFQGAVVMDPEPVYFPSSPLDQKTGIPTLEGHYICTLDFQSLYPNVLIAHNLCYSTYIPPHKVKEYDEKDIFRVPGLPHVFARKHLRKGYLPQMLEELLASRKVVKKKMSEEKDSFMESVLNGLQLALKISANSSFGFTGASTGFLFLLAIAESVTALGRLRIEDSKDFVQKEFSIKNGFSDDSKVRYVDTDSLFIDFGKLSFDKSLEFGHLAAKKLKERLVGMNLSELFAVFEKIYNGFFLIKSKKYVGTKVDPAKIKPGSKIKFVLASTGLENVRRDNAKLCAELIDQCLDFCLCQNNPQGAIDLVTQTVSDLVNDRIDMGKLIDSRSLSKASYKSEGPHTVLSKKLAARDPGSAPRTGDRVSFVILKGAHEKGNKVRDWAEDPMYALKKRLPLDITYYLERLETPLTKILSPILGEKKTHELFHGDHSRVVVVHRNIDGPMMRFVKKSGTCLSCKAPIQDAKEPICTFCEDQRGVCHLKAQATHQEISKEHDKVWDGCMKCASDTIEKQMCANADCSFFFKRQRLILDKAKAKSILDLF